MDINTLLKANQIILREFNLAKILAKSIKIAIETAEAEIGYLILKQKDNLTIEAIASISSSQIRVLQSLPIESKDRETQLPLLPTKIINEVARTREDIIFNNNKFEVKFTEDPYIAANQPKSLLCATLSDRDRLIGVLYLENNLTTGRFTNDSLRLLKTLCTRATIAIAKAQLESKNLEAESTILPQNEEKLMQFLDELPLGISIATGEAKPNYCDRTAKKMLSKGAVDSIFIEELARTYNAYFQSRELEPQAKKLIHQALKGEKTYICDLQIGSDEEIILLDIWASPIINQAGRIECVIFVFDDGSDRKQIEAEHLLLQPVSHNLSYSYQLGGGLAASAASYVVRDGDRELYQAILQSKFAYVFNARQMGKSSLRNKIIAQLRSQGYRCGAIDLTEIGSSNLNSEQWYASLIFHLAKSLEISQFNIRPTFTQWWKNLDPLSSVSKFKKFICEIILKNIESKIVIFIDEIDSIRRLPFDVNDFLALIRFLYDYRAANRDLSRLSFILLGTANPNYLMREPRANPFNIGQQICLKGFKLDEVQPLAGGLDRLCDNSKKVLSEILFWTGGQPFLTQKICHIIVHSGQNIASGDEARSIALLVKEKIIENWQTQDNPAHFQVIEQSILQSANKFALLRLYEQILEQGAIAIDLSDLQIELILSGLVGCGDDFLKIFNQIYLRIFNYKWLTENQS